MAEPLLIRCPVCDTTNRVPRDKIEQGLRPNCGRCRKGLPIHLEPLMVTDATFAAEVESSPLPVLVDVTETSTAAAPRQPVADPLDGSDLAHALMAPSALAAMA